MKLYLVIPCYNEEEVLPETSKRLLEKYEKLIDDGVIDSESKICFVNDGSKDRTWEIIEQLNSENKIFRGIKLSRNKGHQNALMAGLMAAMAVMEAAAMVVAPILARMQRNSPGPAPSLAKTIFRRPKPCWTVSPFEMRNGITFMASSICGRAGMIRPMSI